MDCLKKKKRSIKVPNTIMDPLKVPLLLDVVGKIILALPECEHQEISSKTLCGRQGQGYSCDWV